MTGQNMVAMAMRHDAEEQSSVGKKMATGTFTHSS